MEASLRFVGPETLETKIFGRPQRLAELDLHARRTRPASTAHSPCTASPSGRSSSGRGPSDHGDRPHRREDPEQRQPRGRQAPAARARGVAAEVHRLVEADGPGRLAGARHLPAHRGLRRDRRLGALRLRQDAGLSLGHLPRAEAAEPRARLRRQPGPARLGRGAGRVPQHAAPPRRHAGRHRARVASSSSASSARPRRRSTTCATCSRSTSRKAVTCGRWSTCSTRTSAATAARRPRSCCSAARATADKPRILGAFNEPTSHWLSFFMFTMFTDRDGKYQLAALAESGFDPLARTCRFMLTEEAHHMFVGETGVQRVVKRACELMSRPGDVRAQGGVDLPTLQKYLNLWYSLSLDLFGGEVSSNAADAFAAGLKGRYKEDRYDEHKLIGSHFGMEVLEEGQRRPQGRADAQRAQRGAAHRVHQGLPARRRSLEQDDPRRGHRLRAALPRPQVPSPDRHVEQPPVRAERRAARSADLGRAPRRVAAERRRRDVHQEPHAAGVRARQDGELDRAAGEGHQRAARATSSTSACRPPSGSDLLLEQIAERAECRSGASVRPATISSGLASFEAAIESDRRRLS